MFLCFLDGGRCWSAVTGCWAAIEVSPRVADPWPSRVRALTLWSLCGKFPAMWFSGLYFQQRGTNTQTCKAGGQNDPPVRRAPLGRYPRSGSQVGRGFSAHARNRSLRSSAFLIPAGRLQSGALPVICMSLWSSRQILQVVDSLIWSPALAENIRLANRPRVRTTQGRTFSLGPTAS